MKNLGTLFGYELKKLLRSPLTWTVMALMTALSVFAGLGRLHGDAGQRFYNYEGDDPMEWKLVEFIPEDDWNKRMQEGAQALNGQVMDDAFFRAMVKNVPELTTESRQDYQTLYRWFYYEDPTYYHVYHLVMSAAWASAGGIAAESFYAGRQAILEQRWENYGLSEAEKDYWREMEGQLQRPFVYEYPWNGAGLNCLFTTLYTMIVPLALAAAVCLCRIFAGDRSCRVDALVFASRESRLPLYLAKLLAGCVSALLTAALILGGHMAAYLVRFGVQGLDAPVQMLDIIYSYPVSVGQAVGYMLLIVALYTLACGALTMLVSALTRRTVVALIVPVIILFWLTQSRLTAPYLPHNLITWDGFLDVSLLRVPGGYLNIFQVGALLYLLAAAALSVLCWPCWRRSARGAV